jgi:hypothetical protein
MSISVGAVRLVGAAVLIAVLTPGTGNMRAQPSSQAAPPRAAQARDMELVGWSDLQARSAYQPVIHHQGARFIAYVGHHGGSAVNPATGATEPNGTSILDVTDPARPAYLFHIPGAGGGGESGGAQMARVCDGDAFGHGAAGKTFLLRTLGSSGHEVWDVTKPDAPTLVRTIVSGLASTHKNWWECDTGIAYLVSDGRPSGWRSERITQVYDLADPANPRFIRNFGLAGQQPGATGTAPPGLHGAMVRGDRVYIAYGTSANGVLQIVDRGRLLKGPAEPTVDNLAFPQIGRLDMSPSWGAHTAFPLIGMTIPEFAKNRDGRVRDFVVVPSEAIANQCQEIRHLTFVVDITTPSRPFSVATWDVPEASGGFCDRGGRFGPHATSESYNPMFYGRLVFVSYFNAGVRAVDVRNPYHPVEVAFYIPATTASTDRRCATIAGVETCRTVIQTNNVEVDDRGFVYIVDRANTGMHVLRLTGEAARIAKLP